MFAFSNDPFKPLTEVERAFAAAKLINLRDPNYSEFLGAGAMITIREAAGILGLRHLCTVRSHVRHYGWRIDYDSRKRKRGGSHPLLVSLEDVMQTAERLKSKKRHRNG